jgi:hypothetical protein
VPCRPPVLQGGATEAAEAAPQAWGGGPLIYLTVLSNPLDAVVARFSASRHHVFRSLSDFVEGGVCPFEVGDERCWDADFYTQALASPGLCQGAAGGAAREGREVCSEEAEEEAVKRVESMQVVLMADWLHLSAPVICQALGTAGGAWCDPAASAQLAARVQEESAGWCGVDGLLALDGEGPGGQRAPLLQALIERNRRDLRLFAAARARARSLLVAAGVTPPPDVGGNVGADGRHGRSGAGRAERRGGGGRPDKRERERARKEGEEEDDRPRRAGLGALVAEGVRVFRLFVGSVTGRLVHWSYNLLQDNQVVYV